MSSRFKIGSVGLATAFAVIFSAGYAVAAHVSHGPSGISHGPSNFSHGPSGFSRGPSTSAFTARPGGNFAPRSNWSGPAMSSPTINSGSRWTNHQTFQSPTTAFRPLNQSPATAWTNHQGQWSRNRDFDHDRDFDHFHNRNFFFGFYNPWWYPSYYSYWDPYMYDYGYPYYVYDYSYPYVYGTEAAAPVIAADTQSDFYARAEEAFRAGNYQDAVRLASHAAIDNPRDPNVHLLLSLSMFAMGNYRGAAMEAHGIVAMGQNVDWPSLIGFYSDVGPYTQQLRALEAAAEKNPSSADDKFLLGFLYLTQGNRDAAQIPLLGALTIVPQDRIAADLLTRAGGQVPENIARQQATTPQPGTPGSRMGQLPPAANAPGRY